MNLKVPLLFFYMDGFDVKLRREFDMPLNKVTKPNQTKPNLSIYLSIYLSKSVVFYANTNVSFHI